MSYSPVPVALEKPALRSLMQGELEILVDGCGVQVEKNTLGLGLFVLEILIVRWCETWTFR